MNISPQSNGAAESEEKYDKISAGMMALTLIGMGLGHLTKIALDLMLEKGKAKLAT